MLFSIIAVAYSIVKPEVEVLELMKSSNIVNFSVNSDGGLNLL